MKPRKIADAICDKHDTSFCETLSDEPLRQSITNAIAQARAEALDEAARIAETTDYSVVDFGDPEPGKMFSGMCIFDNRNRETPARIAAAICALHGGGDG